MLTQMLEPNNINQLEHTNPNEPDFFPAGAGTGASISDGTSPLFGEAAGVVVGDGGGVETGGGVAGSTDEGDGEGGYCGWGLCLTAITTTMSFCPLLQLSALPVMKKKGPERSNVKTESPSVKDWIGLLVLHE